MIRYYVLTFLLIHLLFSGFANAKKLTGACEDENGIRDAITTQDCQRKAVIGNKKYVIDILSTKKGEGLRYTMQRDPFALELLEKYQHDSKKIKYAAYTGTPALILTGWRMAQADEVGKDLLFWTGITGILGSYLWGQMLSNSNEDTLENAVSTYNRNASARGKATIQLGEDD